MIVLSLREPLQSEARVAVFKQIHHLAKNVKNNYKTVMLDVFVSQWNSNRGLTAALLVDNWPFPLWLIHDMHFQVEPANPVQFKFKENE